MGFLLIPWACRALHACHLVIKELLTWDCLLDKNPSLLLAWAENVRHTHAEKRRTVCPRQRNGIAGIKRLDGPPRRSPHMRLRQTACQPRSQIPNSRFGRQPGFRDMCAAYRCVLTNGFFFSDTQKSRCEDNPRL